MTLSRLGLTAVPSILLAKIVVDVSVANGRPQAGVRHADRAEHQPPTMTPPRPHPTSDDGELMMTPVQPGVTIWDIFVSTFCMILTLHKTRTTQTAIYSCRVPIKVDQVKDQTKRDAREQMVTLRMRELLTYLPLRQNISSSTHTLWEKREY